MLNYETAGVLIILKNLAVMSTWVFVGHSFNTPGCNYLPTCDRIKSEFRLTEKQRRKLEMLAQVLVEGLLLGILLMMICAIGIRNGAVGMVHLYHQDVKNRCVELGLTTHEKIRRNSKRFKVICISGYMLYILVCVYGINGARDFCSGFWQMFVILSVMNVMDRFLVDGFWVGHTTAWTIPGTEALKPYITREDKRNKWLMGTVGMAMLSAILAGIATLIMSVIR